MCTCEITPPQKVCLECSSGYTFAAKTTLSSNVTLLFNSGVNAQVPTCPQRCFCSCCIVYWIAFERSKKGNSANTAGIRENKSGLHSTQQTGVEWHNIKNIIKHNIITFRAKYKLCFGEDFRKNSSRTELTVKSVSLHFSEVGREKP